MRKIAKLVGMASLAVLATAPVFAQGNNEDSPFNITLSSFATEPKDAVGADQKPCAGDLACQTSCCDPVIGLDVFGGVDAFRGVSDLARTSNFGAVAGINAGMLLPGSAGEHGFGWQLGTSVGDYDLDGKGLADANSLGQYFVTTGFFRKTQCDKGWSYGIVYDWMITTNWGVFDQQATMSQWRAQMEYSFSRCDSVGVYGTLRDMTYVNAPAALIDRSINQVDLFWDHKFCTGADVRVWVGIPEQDTIAAFPATGGIGDFIVGMDAEAPLSDRISLYAGWEYMAPSVGAFHNGAALETYDVSVGLVWHPGRCHCNCGCDSGCNVACPAASAPYLSLGNNSNFLVDQNRNTLVR